MSQTKQKIPIKILLVEDDELTIKTLKFVLERERYEVSIARDGKEAVKMLDSPADLILLDLVIPQKSGFDVLEIIRQEKHIQTPVIIISNLGKSEDIERALKLGANGYIVKNEFPVEAILRKVKAALTSSPE